MKFELTCSEIAKITGGKVVGDAGTVITGINDIEHAGSGEITFYTDSKYHPFFENSEASCIICRENEEISPEKAYIFAENPYLCFFNFLVYLKSAEQAKQPGIDSSAVVGRGTEIPDTTHVGAGVRIGRECVIGENCVILENTVIYDNVTIDSNTYIHANVVICSDSEIGSNCLLHAGCVVGSDGFGFIEDPKDGSYTRIPQLGKVIIEDNCEIGANTTIDRAMVGCTRIKKGVKIDNLCHVAHSCEIGENTGIAAQTGLSGSVKVGKRNRYGGQVGIAGHLEITDNVMIFAKSGISKSINKPGIYFGAPAQERVKAMRREGYLRNLPELFKDVQEIKKAIEK